MCLRKQVHTFLKTNKTLYFRTHHNLFISRNEMSTHIYKAFLNAHYVLDFNHIL